MSGPQQITVGVNCFVKMSAHICLLNSSLRGWLNLVMSTEACDTLGPESKDVRGLSQVSVNTWVMWLSGMGGIAAIHSEWHCSLICVGLIVPQISQPFAIVSSLLPEGKVSHKSHQPRSWVWNMPASFILSGMSGSASWVLSIYHLISPKGSMHPERSLCSGSALCVQPPANVHLYGCKGIAIPVFPEFTAQQSVT